MLFRILFIFSVVLGGVTTATTLLASKLGSDVLEELEIEAEIEELEMIDTQEGIREAERANLQQAAETKEMRQHIERLESQSGRLKSKQGVLMKRFGQTMEFAKTAEVASDRADKKHKIQSYKVKSLQKQVKKYEARALRYKKAKRLTLREIKQKARLYKALEKRKKTALRVIKSYKRSLKKNKKILRKVKSKNSRLKKVVTRVERDAVRLKQASRRTSRTVRSY